MEDLFIFVTAGGVATLFVEFLKWFWRKYIVKNQEYDFSKRFYYVAIPVLSSLAIPLLAFLGVSEYIMPTDWVEFGKYAVLVLLSSLVSSGAYNMSLKPIKEKG